MATAEELVADLQAYTEAGTTLPSANALECLNLTLRRMQRRHDWQAMQAIVQLTIPGGTTNWAALPYDFLREIYVYSISPNTSNPDSALVPAKRFLKPQWFSQNSPWMNADPIFPNVAAPSTQAQQLPERGYYVFNGQLVIVPAPSISTLIELDYSRRLADLVLGLTPPDENVLSVLYPDVVRAGALAEAYSFLHEEERTTHWMTVYELRVKEAIDADNAIAFAGPPAKRGT